MRGLREEAGQKGVLQERVSMLKCAGCRGILNYVKAGVKNTPCRADRVCKGARLGRSMLRKPQKVNVTWKEPGSGREKVDT